MTIRTKLLLFFLTLSMLTFASGIIFYSQLKNLVKPLTVSIPQSMQQLQHALDRNDLIDRLLYNQLLVSRYLENFVFTLNESFLHKYYVSHETLMQLEKKLEKVDPELWEGLTGSFKNLDVQRHHILQLTHDNKVQEAKNIILAKEYPNALQATISLLGQYYQMYGVIANESSYVTVRTTAKNTIDILQDSLNTTIIIFINAIIISIVLAFLSAKQISQPIRLLRKNMQRMEAENLSAPLNPELYRFKGEIGTLSHSFIALVNRLRATTVLRDDLLVEVERRKVIEAQLKETLMDLEQFAYVASHDLRAPLRGIANLIELIERDIKNQLTDNSKENMVLIVKRIRRLDALIVGILEYSRAGRMYLNKEKLDLNKLIPEIIDSLAPASNVNIMVDNVLPVVTANRVSMSQIFMNLISNAIKYNNKTDIIIHIGHKDISDCFEFYVADNGPGIDRDYHQKIFEVFQTLQSKDKIEGTGIGLSIVKKIIEKNGGRIWLASVVGEGTIFYFTWPHFDQ